MAKGHALTLLGLIDEASDAIALAVLTDEVEADFERAELADSFLDPDAAWRSLEALNVISRSNNDARNAFGTHAALFHARRGRGVEARAVLAEVPPNAGSSFPRGIHSAPRDERRMLRWPRATRNGAGLADASAMLAREQGATRWRRVAELIRSVGDTSQVLSAAVQSVGHSSPWNLTLVADIFTNHAAGQIFDEAALRGNRNSSPTSPWPMALRLAWSDRGGAGR